MALKERLDGVAHHYYAEPRDWRRIAEANPDALFAEDLLYEARAGRGQRPRAASATSCSSRARKDGALMVSLGALLDPGFRQPASCLIEVGDGARRHRHHRRSGDVGGDHHEPRRGGDRHDRHRGPAQGGRPVDRRRLRPVHALGADQGLRRLPDPCRGDLPRLHRRRPKPSYPEFRRRDDAGAARPGRERRARPRADAHHLGRRQRR